MTICIRVKMFYDGNDGDDYLGLMRIGDRIEELRSVLKYSTKPFSIRHYPLFDDVGGVKGEEYEFWVEDVYENIVLDTIRSLNENGNMGWREWFRSKYKVACA